MLPTNPHSLAEKYTYDSSSKICMFSENECCYHRRIQDCCNIQDGVLRDNGYQLPVVNYYHKGLHLGCCSSPRSASGYFTGVTMEEFPADCYDVEYYERAKADGKLKIVVKPVDVEEAIELLNEQVKILKAHIFVKRTQNTHYNRLKENLKTDEFIIHVN